MPSRIVKVADCSFLQFVYPFTFQPEMFAEREWALDRNNEVWVSGDFVAAETLSHVADYLRPLRADQTRSARLWRLSEQGHMPLRLSSDLDCLLRADKEEFPFRFCGPPQGSAAVESAAVELVLFGIGVGFLTVAVRPTAADIPTWLAFLHYFRVMKGSHDVSLSIAPSVDTAPPHEFAGGAVNFAAIRDRLLGTAASPKDGRRHWWYDVFVPDRMIPFAVLFVDGMEDEHARAEFLYRTRNVYRAEQTVIATAEDLQVRGNPALLPYVEGQQFLFSLEGGSFVAFDAPCDNAHFRTTLPVHLRDQYFLIFLLALHQRFALIRLSQRVAERWAEEEERFDRFECIRRDFLDFTARGYFAQLMQREHYHRFYRKWHEVFQMDRLYEEVRDEVREMHEYLRMEQAERAQELQEVHNTLIARFGIVISLTATVFGFLGINSTRVHILNISPRSAIWVALGMLLLGAALVCQPLRRVNQIGRQRANRRGKGRKRGAGSKTDKALAAKASSSGVKAGDIKQDPPAGLKAGS